MMRKWKHSIALIIAMALPRAAEATATDMFDNALDIVTSGFDYLWPDAMQKHDVRLRLGVGVGTSPDYIGSNNYRFRVLPLIDLRYKDMFVLQSTKLRMNLISKGSVKAGPLLNYKFGRSQDANPVLNGWGDVGDTVQAGAFVEIKGKSFLASADVRHALGASMGAEVNGLLAHGLYKNDKFSLFAGARLKWSSKSYNQTLFGVTPQQAEASGLPAFHPGAGFSTTDINLIGRYQLRHNVFLESLIGEMLVLGGPAKSPLVAGHGKRNQFVGGVGLRYAF